MSAGRVAAFIYNALLVVAYLTFIIISIVSYIRDGKEAQKEKRRRRTGVKVRFIISMILLVFGVLVCVFILPALNSTYHMWS